MKSLWFPDLIICVLFMFISYFFIFNPEIQRPWELLKAVVSQNPLAGESVFYLSFVSQFSDAENIPYASEASTERAMNLSRPERHF